MSWRIGIGWVAVLLGAAGCGSSGPFEYMPVKGKLTYEDGSVIPAPGILLQFKTDAKPIDGMSPRAAQAMLDPQGVFTCATSYKYGDGLIPGKHKVALQYAVDAKGKLLVPKDYTSIATTPLEIDTGDGNLEIKVPKP